MTSLPRGLQQLVGNTQEDLNDHAYNFIDFKQGLDRAFGMVKHEVKRKTIERTTRAG
jgi:hypothetical protein